MVNSIFNPSISASVDFNSAPVSTVWQEVTTTIFSYTVPSGINTFLCVPVYDRNISISSVTYGANSLTSYGYAFGGATNSRVEIWGLVNPPVGTDTITVNFASNEYNSVGAISFKNVNQFSPISGVTTDSVNADSASLTISSYLTSMVFGAITYWNPGGDIALGGGLYSLWAESDGAWKTSGFTKSGNSSVNLSVSNMGTGDYHAFIGFSIDAA